MKKNVITLVLMVIGVTAIAIGGAYALFTFTQASTKTNTATVGTLTMTMSDTAFTLNNAVPQSDAVGSTNTPYSMTVENTGTLGAKYSVCLIPTVDTSATECTVANAAELYNKVRFNVDDGTTYYTLGTLTQGSCAAGQLQFPSASTTYTLAGKTATSGPTNTHKFRMWFSQDAGNEIMKCKLTVKTTVNATQTNR